MIWDWPWKISHWLLLLIWAPQDTIIATVAMVNDLKISSSDLDNSILDCEKV